MKHILLTVTVLLLSGGNLFAGEGHAHGKGKQGSHAHKECGQCKKDEKNCKCDENEKDHDKSEDKKKSN